jgi:hypothetical protein
VEWIGRKQEHPFAVLPSNIIVRWIIYVVVLATIIEFYGGQQEFVYFQF